MDSRLKSWVDDNGQCWVLCEHCTKETRVEDLALDPTDGLRWNVCAPCKRKETALGTAGGVVLTDQAVNDLADEADEGYPVEQLRPRRAKGKRDA